MTTSWRRTARRVRGVRRCWPRTGASAHNTGDHDEQRLRYAEDDARRVHEVIRELGGFRPENMLLLHGEGFRRRGL